MLGPARGGCLVHQRGVEPSLTSSGAVGIVRCHIAHKVEITSSSKPSSGCSTGSPVVCLWTSSLRLCRPSRSRSGVAHKLARNSALSACRHLRKMHGSEGFAGHRHCPSLASGLACQVTVSGSLPLLRSRKCTTSSWTSVDGFLSFVSAASAAALYPFAMAASNRGQRLSNVVWSPLL